MPALGSSAVGMFAFVDDSFTANDHALNAFLHKIIIYEVKRLC
jgi:hypothetical protein